MFISGGRYGGPPRGDQSDEEMNLMMRNGFENLKSAVVRSANQRTWMIQKESENLKNAVVRSASQRTWMTR